VELLRSYYLTMECRLWLKSSVASMWRGWFRASSALAGRSINPHPSFGHLPPFGGRTRLWAFRGRWVLWIAYKSLPILGWVYCGVSRLPKSRRLRKSEAALGSAPSALRAPPPFSKCENGGGCGVARFMRDGFYGVQAKASLLLGCLEDEQPKAEHRAALLQTCWIDCRMRGYDQSQAGTFSSVSA
jgi:hypothetical protein